MKENQCSRNIQDVEISPCLEIGALLQFQPGISYLFFQSSGSEKYHPHTVVVNIVIRKGNHIQIRRLGIKVHHGWHLVCHPPSGPETEFFEAFLPFDQLQACIQPGFGREISFQAESFIGQDPVEPGSGLDFQGTCSSQLE